jgi:hypothetical protein
VISLPHIHCTFRILQSIVDVQQDAEPPFFTQHFVGWDSSRRATIPDVYKEKLKLKDEERQAS